MEYITLTWSQKEMEILIGGSLVYKGSMLIWSSVYSGVKLLTDFVIPLIIHEDVDNVDCADIRERFEQVVNGAFEITLCRSFVEGVECDE